MAARLDAIQTVVNRAPDTAAQTHAAQRQPIAAQEHAAAANRHDATVREQRSEALARRDGREAKNDLIPATRDRESGRGRPRRRLPPPSGGAGGAADDPNETPDGKGNLLDLRV